MTDEERAVLEDCISNDQVPHTLRCSITHELMLEPAVVNGHCFERRAIAAWLATNPRDPVTREPASPSDLRPDWSVRAAVTFFLDQARSRVLSSPPATLAPATNLPARESNANIGNTSSSTSSRSEERRVGKECRR